MVRLQQMSYILLALLLFSVMQPSYADPPLPTPVGRVVWVQGTLKAIMPNKEERLLQKTSLIYLQDTLVTNSSSQAQIVFTDNSLMTFNENTKFFINQYEFNPKAKKSSIGKYVMDLIEGGFRTITGLIAKDNPGDYQISTPVATIGVRGTDYAVYFRNGQVYMNYYSGSPCITSKGTLCLTKEIPYANVPARGAAPVALQEQPAVFKEKLEIKPATIAPFASEISTQGQIGGSPEGTVSSFCIQ